MHSSLAFSPQVYPSFSKAYLLPESSFITTSSPGKKHEVHHVALRSASVLMTDNQMSPFDQYSNQGVSRRNFLSGTLLALTAVITLPSVARADRSAAMIKTSQERYLPRLQAFYDLLKEAKPKVASESYSEVVEILSRKEIEGGKRAMIIYAGVFSDSAISKQTAQLKKLADLCYESIQNAIAAASNNDKEKLDTSFQNALMQFTKYAEVATLQSLRTGLI